MLLINLSFAFAQKTVAPQLDMTVNRGVIKPISLAVPSFIKESGANSIISRELAKVISNNLNGTGLFKSIPQTAYVSTPLSFNTPVQFSDWSIINADVLVVGSVGLKPDGRLEVKFRLWDVSQQKEIGKGKQYFTNSDENQQRNNLSNLTTINPIFQLPHSALMVTHRMMGIKKLDN